MQSRSVKEANKAFVNKDYEKAYKHYYNAGETFGPALFSANLRICQKRIAKAYGESIINGFDFTTIEPLMKHIELDQDSISMAQSLDSTRSRRALIHESLTISKTDGFSAAVEFLNAHKLQSLQLYTMLKANMHLPDKIYWLSALNKYLELHRQTPVSLMNRGEAIVSNLRASPSIRECSGPKVSVLMPAYNAHSTIRAAAQSILRQGWRNLELIIVDDCSKDDTFSICQDLKRLDPRVIAVQNKENVGPYVSKNRALSLASGDWITGHDADDWAHPDRISTQVISAHSGRTGLSLGYMIRVRSNWAFSSLGPPSSFSPDGCKRKALISTMFNRKLLCDKLGSWDCVRFGGDSEILARAEIVLGRSPEKLSKILMICLDDAHNLTNHPEYGLQTLNRPNSPRSAYRQSWATWHEGLSPLNASLPFPHLPRRFPVPGEAEISSKILKTVAEWP